MKVKAIAEKIDSIFPIKLAQSWDNVGLLVGNPEKNVKNILLTIDITADVLTEAKRLRTDLFISYHPVIWDGLKNITADGTGSIVYDLIRADISVFSIHTVLDSAVGGVNDGLAEILGIENPQPLGDFVPNPRLNDYKLVIYVPVNAIAKVSNAVFAAGAGWIGNYSRCSFNTPGIGTFLPLEGSKPYIGKKGKVERVPEIRFETIVPAEKIDSVLSAMKQAHPYEEPAFDVFKMHNDRQLFGLGRIGKLAKPQKLAEIIKKVKRATGAKAVGIVGPQNRTVKSAAVCAGSCGPIINSIIAAGVDLYLTGELKHHQALAAQESNLTCLCLSHTVSERFILKKLARLLQKELAELTIRISKTDADPFIWKEL